MTKVKKKDKKIECPDCGNEVTNKTEGECNCGKNNWNWNLYDGHLVCICNNCKYMMTWTVDYPLTDLFFRKILGDETGRIKHNKNKQKKS